MVTLEDAAGAEGQRQCWKKHEPLQEEAGRVRICQRLQLVVEP